ncbi:hypothetical protein A0O34_05920 [Chryseobacterium glaciei]|uniref:Lipoprotein n=1 Tax=Chryseobacterium glaciei TaxID=1685010 RepID=A0A172XT01_9FLAO|nr:hypothetical protein [Chryseobacterium glaciei]ANF50074.1 hypothetical protein A0O34_05920 [Chryseobacterium glaciei]
MTNKLLYRRIIFYTLIFSVTSCTTFDKSTKENNFNREGQHVKFKNDALGIENLTYGGLNIIDSKEKKKEYPSIKLKYNNIVYYASMNMGYKEKNVEYDYYILSKFNNIDSNQVITKKIICNSKEYYLVISKKIPVEDRPLLIDNFKCINK